MMCGEMIWSDFSPRLKHADRDNNLCSVFVCCMVHVFVYFAGS